MHNLAGQSVQVRQAGFGSRSGADDKVRTIVQGPKHSAADAAGRSQDQNSCSGGHAVVSSVAIISAAFSPIMMAAALVLPPTMVGMIDASATPQPGDTSHPEVMIDDGQVVLSHLAGADLMVAGRKRLAGVGVDLVIRVDVGPGHQLAGIVGLETLPGWRSLVPGGTPDERTTGRFRPTDNWHRCEVLPWGSGISP